MLGLLNSFSYWEIKGGSFIRNCAEPRAWKDSVKPCRARAPLGPEREQLFPVPSSSPFLHLPLLLFAFCLQSGADPPAQGLCPAPPSVPLTILRSLLQGEGEAGDSCNCPEVAAESQPWEGKLQHDLKSKFCQCWFSHCDIFLL